jgi:uncharacterized protein (DUF1499 family)
MTANKGLEKLINCVQIIIVVLFVFCSACSNQTGSYDEYNNMSEADQYDLEYMNIKSKAYSDMNIGINHVCENVRMEIQKCVSYDTTKNAFTCENLEYIMKHYDELKIKVPASDLLTYLYYRSNINPDQYFIREETSKKVIEFIDDKGSVTEIVNLWEQGEYALQYSQGVEDMRRRWIVNGKDVSKYSWD